MQYDVATKRLMEIDGTSILRQVGGLDVREMKPLDELPQEQTAITRNDFAAKCVLGAGVEAIVLVEFQTVWRRDKLLDMLIYAAHRMRRHDLQVVQIMLLFQPSEGATDRFERDGLTFQFRLVKVWELPVDLFLEPTRPGLWPLAPLAKDGLASAGQVDKLLHSSDLSSSFRSDLLTIFAIFLGLRDKEVAKLFIRKRREFMIESPIYDLIKEEGREEGLREGRKEGHKEGREEGAWIGKIQLLEQMMGLPETPSESFRGISHEEIRQRFEGLQNTYNLKFKR